MENHSTLCTRSRSLFSYISHNASTIHPSSKSASNHNPHLIHSDQPRSPIHKHHFLTLISTSTLKSAYRCTNSMPTQLSSPIRAPAPTETIKVLVGPPSNPPHVLSIRQLHFYSPYLRILTERAEPYTTIILPDDDHAAFDVLVSWMNDGTTMPCHQRGAALDQQIKVEDKEGVPLAFKVWVLTHRLGGPCLVLRDECMRYIHETYTGKGGRVITPAVAMYVFKDAGRTELKHLVGECLARDGTKMAGVEWEGVVRRIPALKKVTRSASWQTGIMRLDGYMCPVGKVTPNWGQT